jgi:YNFM family putative membrane transporter
VSMVAAALLNIVAALLPSWNGILFTRALEGLVLGGVPAVAMAWLAEEMDPRHLGKAMGLYVGGTAFGAMIGRVGMGLMAEFTSWQSALCMLGVACLACACGFLALLPKSRNFVAKPGINLMFHLRSWQGHLNNRSLRRLYVLGFVLTSVFASLFNYASFHLSMAPYNLGQMEASLIFLTFSFGIVSSTVAGQLVDRYGKRRPLLVALLVILAGVMLTLSSELALIISGIALVTTGFFIGHSVVSSQVGPSAGSMKGHATSLYLLFYYMGASVTGSVSGWIWQHGGWRAIVAFNVMLVGLGLRAVLAKPAGLRT